MICVSLSDRKQLDTLNVSEKLMYELRFDLIEGNPEDLVKGLKGAAGIIATCRPGKFNEEEQYRVLKMAILAGVSHIDVEIDAEAAYRSRIISMAREYGVKVIISWHNYTATPSSDILGSILNECYELGGDLAKIACMVNEPADSARLLALYQYPGEKVIIGMGEMGKISRIAALMLGASFSFAAPETDEATAPGQFSIEEMEQLLQYFK